MNPSLALGVVVAVVYLIRHFMLRKQKRLSLIKIIQHNFTNSPLAEEIRRFGDDDLRLQTKKSQSEISMYLQYFLSNYEYRVTKHEPFTEIGFKLWLVSGSYRFLCDVTRMQIPGSDSQILALNIY